MNEKPDFYRIEPDLCNDCKFADFRPGEIMRCKRKDCDNRMQESNLLEPLTKFEYEKLANGYVRIKVER